ncbi:hypothetical protein HYZ41_02940 [archaeon]|nr:hypothetical protein [archaeon]
MNRHIKVINGRQYYYSSIRKGKKVTSKYLGPVERIRNIKKTVEEQANTEATENVVQETADESYIG